MYVAGAANPNREPARKLLARVGNRELDAVTSTEVLQEILHRYVAINRRDAIQPAFDAVLGIVDEVFPVDQASTQRAKEILFGNRALSARDAIHLAIMEREGVEEILSFDSGFDGFPGVQRKS